MPAWAYAVIGVVVGGLLTWLKLGGLSGAARKLAKVSREQGDVAKVIGDFLDEFANAWEDKKLQPEEVEKLGARAKIIKEQSKEFWEAVKSFIEAVKPKKAS